MLLHTNPICGWFCYPQIFFAESVVFSVYMIQKTITAQTLEELDALVNTYYRNGYIPCGEVHRYIDDTNHCEYVQTILHPELESEDIEF